MGFSLFDPTSWFDSGGSSSSASVTSNVNLKLEGLDNIKETLTLDIKPIEVKPLELKPLTINENIDLKPIELKPVTLNENIDLKPLEIKPITLNENIDLKPVTLNENIDLKPVAIDSCQTLRLAPLPETRVCQPYHHHVGYTLFGVELMGVTYQGESEQLIGSPHHPQVVERTERIEHRHAKGPTELGTSRGIRVRVLDPDGE